MKPLDETQQAARDQFDKQSANYGKSHILARTDDIAAVLEGVELPEGARALDVATGGGHTALYLASRGLAVTAADIAPGMLETASRLAAEQGFSLDTQLHEAEKLPYADGAFFLVSCRVAAHHFSDRPAFIREVFRVLQPGGWFLLIDGSVPDGEPEAEEWIHQIEKIRDPSHGRFLSPSAWRALCEEAGFQVSKCATTPLQQPDLEWYFQAAGTPAENRERVLELIRTASPEARRVFRLEENDGKITWWWPRLGLLARREEG